MNPKTKKILIIAGISLDVAVTLFLFVLSIIILATMPHTNAEMNQAMERNGAMIGFFQQNPLAILLICVLPLVLLLIANIVLLVLYVKKAGKIKATVNDLSEEQKAALRAELLKEIDSEEKKEEK